MASIDASTGRSSDKGSEKAGRKAVENALEDMEEDESIVLLFASSEKDQEAVLEGANQATDAEIVGCSTAGEIMGERSYTKNVVAMALGGDGVEAVTGVGENVSEKSKKAGREAANSMLSNFEGAQSTVMATEEDQGWSSYPRIMGVALGPGIAGDNGQMMSGIQDIVGPMPIAGGWAGDDWALEQSYLYKGQDVLEDSIILAGLKLDLKSGIGVAHGLKDSLDGIKLTSVEGNWVKEINGKPALEFYRGMFGKKAENPQFLLTRPIGIDTQENELRIREPLDIDKEEESIMFSESLPEGINAELMNASADQVIEGAEKAVEMALDQAGDPDDIAAVVIHDCACRWYFLDQKGMIEEELSVVNEKVGDDVPVIGWYTYGEIASPAPLNGVRHQNIVVQVLTEEPIE